MTTSWANLLNHAQLCDVQSTVWDSVGWQACAAVGREFYEVARFRLLRVATMRTPDSTLRFLEMISRSEDILPWRVGLSKCIQELHFKVDFGHSEFHRTPCIIAEELINNSG